MQLRALTLQHLEDDQFVGQEREGYVEKSRVVNEHVLILGHLKQMSLASDVVEIMVVEIVDEVCDDAGKRKRRQIIRTTIGCDQLLPHPPRLS